MVARGCMWDEWALVLTSWVRVYQAFASTNTTW